MHIRDLKEHPEKLAWVGRFTVDQGWGPKNLVRELASSHELQVVPDSEIKNFEEVFNVASEIDENTLVPKISTTIENCHYKVTIPHSRLEDLWSLLYKLHRQGHQVDLTIEEDSRNLADYNTNVRKLVVESRIQGEQSVLVTGLHYSTWQPDYESVPDRLIIYQTGEEK